MEGVLRKIVEIKVVVASSNVEMVAAKAAKTGVAAVEIKEVVARIEAAAKVEVRVAKTEVAAAEIRAAVADKESRPLSTLINPISPYKPSR